MGERVGEGGMFKNAIAYQQFIFLIFPFLERKEAEKYFTFQLLKRFFAYNNRYVIFIGCIVQLIIDTFIMQTLRMIQ